jgi:hypothetical protein
MGFRVPLCDEEALRAALPPKNRCITRALEGASKSRVAPPLTSSAIVPTHDRRVAL